MVIFFGPHSGRSPFLGSVFEFGVAKFVVYSDPTLLAGAIVIRFMEIWEKYQKMKRPVPDH